MGVTELHIISIVSILSALGAGFFHLHAGLLILTFFGPFFTLLHEMSPGSPVYFLWPFALCGVMVLSIVCREILDWKAPMFGRKGMIGLWGFAGALAVIFVGIVWVVDGFQSVFFDVKMAEFRALLENRNMTILGTVMSFVLLLFLGLYFREMKRREGRYRSLDFAVAAFLMYGLFQVVYTAKQYGVFFVGLDGFRYYFFMAIVYFLGRYAIREREQERQLLIALGLACFLGAIQFMAEGYMLNILKIPPEEMPWVGHLFKNWDYLPEGDRAFFEGGYRPLGLMYMTHFSGLFLLFGLAIWLPRLFIARRWKDGALYGIPVLLVSLTAFWTSRTVLLLLVSLYVGAAVLMRASWQRALAGGVALSLFCLFSSYYLLPILPGFRYDVMQEVKYIVSSVFPDNWRAIKVDWHIITGQGKERQRAVVDESPPAKSPSDSKSLILREELLVERKGSLQSIQHYLVGRGASFWGWSALFFPTELKTKTAFVATSYSDFKYLEVFEQFGLLGIISLLIMGVLSIMRGISTSWKERDPRVRATRVGMTSIVVIGFVAMLHLPSLFKVGINSSVYMVMAMLMREPTGPA